MNPLFWLTDQYSLTEKPKVSRSRKTGAWNIRVDFTTTLDQVYRYKFPFEDWPTAVRTAGMMVRDSY